MGQFVYIPYLKYKDSKTLYSDNVDSRGYIITDSDNREVHEKYMSALKSEYGNMSNMNSEYSGSPNFNYLNKKYGIMEYKEKRIDDTKYEFFEIPCTIKDMDGRISDSSSFIQHCFSKDMCIYVFDFDLNNIAPDGESELRFWTKDSMSINIHEEIPNEERIKMLPVKTIKVRLDNMQFELYNCRIIDFEAPFSIAVLAEKINK